MYIAAESVAAKQGIARETAMTYSRQTYGEEGYRVVASRFLLADCVEKSIVCYNMNESWSAPLYNQNAFLVQFAAYKKHIGFYCRPAAISYFKLTRKIRFNFLQIKNSL